MLETTAKERIRCFKEYPGTSSLVWQKKKKKRRSIFASLFPVHVSHRFTLSRLLAFISYALYGNLLNPNEV